MGRADVWEYGTTILGVYNQKQGWSSLDHKRRIKITDIILVQGNWASPKLININRKNERTWTKLALLNFAY